MRLRDNAAPGGWARRARWWWGHDPLPGHSYRERVRTRRHAVRLPVACQRWAVPADRVRGALVQKCVQGGHLQATPRPSPTIRPSPGPTLRSSAQQFPCCGAAACHLNDIIIALSQRWHSVDDRAAIDAGHLHVGARLHWSRPVFASGRALPPAGVRRGHRCGHSQPTIIRLCRSWLKALRFAHSSFVRQIRRSVRTPRTSGTTSAAGPPVGAPEPGNPTLAQRTPRPVAAASQTRQR